ncbi:hypothetical protein JTB14_001428 [Gonioctena quinquepunctata]|nr:hypothetical protein JTB14_001428 [Gonioctena quinquepunctata]
MSVIFEQLSLWCCHCRKLTTKRSIGTCKTKKALQFLPGVEYAANAWMQMRSGLIPSPSSMQSRKGIPLRMNLHFFNLRVNTAYCNSSETSLG